MKNFSHICSMFSYFVPELKHDKIRFSNIKRVIKNKIKIITLFGLCFINPLVWMRVSLSKRNPE